MSGPALVACNGGAPLEAATVLDGTWNGWVRPLFTREQAERVLEALAASGWSHSWDGDRLTVLDEDGEQEGTYAPDDAGLYPLGLDGWTWHLAQPQPQP